MSRFTLRSESGGVLVGAIATALIALTAVLCLQLILASGAAAHQEGDSPYGGRVPGQPDFEKIGKTVYRFKPAVEEYEIRREGRPPAFAHVEFQESAANSQEAFAGPNTPLPEHEDAPICRTSGHRVVVVYTHRPADTTPTPAAEIRSIVNRMNWKIVSESSLSSGGARSVQMAVDCTGGGTIQVHDVATSNNDLSTVSSAVAAALYGQPAGTEAVKYLAFDHEANASAAGVGVLNVDPKKTFTNYNATNTAQAVIYNGPGVWTNHVAIHEMFHTFGATQGASADPPPLSTLGAHCTDGLDMLCYADGTKGSSAFSESVCPASEGYDQPDKTPVDCGKNTYFNAAPASGNWLADHWNVGGEENPFLVNESDVLLKADSGAVVGLTAAEAKVRGTVAAAGSLETKYRFEYGTTTSYGSSSPSSFTKVSAVPGGTSVESALTGLAPGTTYHYRLAASNSKGTVYGEDKTFVTSMWKVRSTPSYEKSFTVVDIACSGKGACTAVGTHLTPTNTPAAMRWSGGEWEAQSLPVPSGAGTTVLEGVSCSTATSCIAVGHHFVSGDQRPLAEHWNGSTWSVVSVPKPAGAEGEAALRDISCVSATSCIAVGDYRPEKFGGSRLTLVETWNGEAWTVVSSPNPEGATTSFFESVSCTAGNACTAVGQTKKPPKEEGEKVEEPLIERWNGTSWSLQASTVSIGEGNLLYDVSCASATVCIAVGEIQRKEGALRWNGSAWAVSELFEPKKASFGSQLRGVSCLSATDCYAMGQKGQGQHWNGTAWATEDAVGSIAGATVAIRALTCWSSTTCLTGGSYFNGTKQIPVIEQRSPYVAPVATTKAASGIAPREATLNATINPGGTETTYEFEYGLTTSYGSKVPVAPEEAGAGTSDIAVSKVVTGLKVTGTYHFRVVAHNELGTTYGKDETFQTPTNWSSTELSWTGSTLKGISCLSAKLCVAVGQFNRVGIWDGTSWSSNMTPQPEDATGTVSLQDVSCSDSSHCVATGFYTLKSSGKNVPYAATGNSSKSSEWLLAKPFLPGGISSGELKKISCPQFDMCVAVGNYYEGSNAKALMEIWDGEEWRIESLSEPSATASWLTGIDCLSAQACKAVGRFSDKSPDGFLLSWDGSKWSYEGLPNPAGGGFFEPESISCTSMAACAVVGDTNESASPYHRPYAMVWDGSEWSGELTPTIGVYENRLQDVSCSSADACTAVGYFASGYAAVPTAQAAKWDGSEWSQQEMKSGPASLDGVACLAAETCFVTGWKPSMVIVESQRGFEPVARTTLPTSIGENGATLNAKVNPEGKATTYQFEYGKTTALGSKAPAVVESAGAGTSDVSVSAGVEGLEAGQTYHYRVVASNENGKSSGRDVVFVTAPGAPRVSTGEGWASAEGEPIEPGEPIAMTLAGTVDPMGVATSYQFEYGTSPSYGFKFPVSPKSAGSGIGEVEVSEEVPGVKSGVTYYFRLVATNSHGTVKGGKAHLTMPAGLPTAVTEAATEVKQTTAKLKGTVSAGKLATTYQFEYGTTTAYGSKAPASAASAGSGIEDVPVSEAISGLKAVTTYHYRLIATNSEGKFEGKDMTFTTVASAPAVTTEAATSVGEVKATLRGKVNPGAASTTYQFEYGKTTSYGSKAPISPKSAGSGTADVEVSEVIEGLEPATIYHYRLSATNSVGTTNGEDKTLKTTSKAGSWTLRSAPLPEGESSYGYSFDSVSCASAEACAAVASYEGEDEEVGWYERSAVEMWNGSAWSLKEIPKPAGTLGYYEPLEDVSCASSSFCAAVGNYEGESGLVPFVERWNGTKWSVEGVPLPVNAGNTSAASLDCSSSSKCVMVGNYYDTVNKDVRTFAEVWNGSTWSVKTLPQPEAANLVGRSMKSISCATAEACTAIGGYIRNISGTYNYYTFASKLSGSTWTTTATPGIEGKIANFPGGVSCASASDCRAVGYYGNPSPYDPFAQAFNGSSWSVQSLAEVSTTDRLLDVSCATSTYCTAVGGSAAVAETWNGSKWSEQALPVPAGSSSSERRAVDCVAAEKCIVVGSYNGESGEMLLVEDQF